MNKTHEASFEQDAFLDGRIQSMEQAYRVQFTASEVFDIKKEPESVRLEYGDAPYGTGCLLARRLIERACAMCRCIMVRDSLGTIISR